MNINKLQLLARLPKSLPVIGLNAKRRLYTDSIYPYPSNYIQNTYYPTIYCYRENANNKPITHDPYGSWLRDWGMKIFWTYWFFMAFNDPGAFVGHFEFPDPHLWTDAELGIPPLEAGPYQEYIEALESKK